MSLDLELTFSLSPPPPTPSPEPSESVSSFEGNEPSNKRRKLNSLKVEHRNSNSNNRNYINAKNTNNSIKDESLSNLLPLRRKRKLPPLSSDEAITTRRSRNKYKNKSNLESNIKQRAYKENKKKCNIKSEIGYNDDIEDEDDDIISFNWNNIAVTSLTTIFEYINIKCLYLNASKVCKYWYSTICGKNSDFIFGFFRKTMHQNPSEPLTLKQLKSYNVPYIKQELKARKLRVNGKKSELIERLYQNIKKDALQQNINNKESIINRKRLILFQIQQLFKNDLFCQNCHKNWNEYFKLNKKTLTKKDIINQLTDIHLNMRICRKCQNLKEYQDINREHALKYYGLNEIDFKKCGIILKHGKGQMINVTTTFYDDYTNAYVCEQIGKMKYSKKDFKRRTIDKQKELAMKARGLLKKGEFDKYTQIYAPYIEYNIDKTRFEFDEILYNARLSRL